jgi:hypothetical protein
MKHPFKIPFFYRLVRLNDAHDDIVTPGIRRRILEEFMLSYAENLAP